MEHLLEQLLESDVKARLLRIFMRNAESFFTLEDLVKRTQLRSVAVKKELEKFLKLGVIQKRIHSFSLERTIRSKKKVIIKKVPVYYVEPQFLLFEELRGLIAKSSVTSREKIVSRLKNLGRLKLVVISGVFLNKDNARTDLLIIGDGVNKRKLDTFLRATESEMGKALHYTVMDTKEFRYRMDMYDRFLRDILEYPHEKIINKYNL